MTSLYVHRNDERNWLSPVLKTENNFITFFLINYRNNMSTILVTEIITVKPIELFSRSIQYQSTLKNMQMLDLSMSIISH